MSSTVKAVIFDLDDTLYVEGDFFRSGFSAVGTELEKRGVGRRSEIASMLIEIHFNEGREGVFQKAAARIPFPAEWISDLVTLFRSHEPNIKLAPDVCRLLRLFRAEYRLGCVTDGWAEVQRRKLSALGMEAFFDALVIADDFGRAFWKPDPLPFKTCCKLLEVSASEAVFVGDNPERDMKGARNAGIRSIRVRRQDSYFYAIDCTPPDLADLEIQHIAELQAALNLLNRSFNES